MIIFPRQNMGTRKPYLILVLFSFVTHSTVLSADPGSNPTPTQDNLSTSSPLRYVRGVYEVPQSPNAIPVIYDSYFPIIFEFKLPTWDIHSMKIQFWKDHNNCTDSDKFTDGYPCPIMYHSNKWIEYFVGNMTLWKNLFLDDPLEHPGVLDDNPDLDQPLLFSRPHSPILDQEYYCSKITNHFTNFQTTRSSVANYYRVLNKCDNEAVIIHKNLNATSPFLETLYHATFSSFVSDYWDRLPDMISKQGTSLGLWTSLEGTLLLHQFMETQKWSQATSACQQGQIPWSLIDQDEISNAIRSHVHLFEHQLAIPLSEMSKYYKLPLTDCVFIGKDELLVRILVPIRSHAKELQDGDSGDRNSYKIIKFEPIIFHEDGEFCWIDGIREKRYISDGGHPGNLYVTECSDQEQKLCRVPVHHYSSHDAADPCAQALYLGNENDIVTSCPLKCVPTQERHYNHKYFNFAHTFDDNFIYAVGDDGAGLEITCKGPSISKRVKVGKLTYAAWNMTLPCGCDILGGSESSPRINFEIAAPCQDQFIVERIRPYHWRNGSDWKKKLPSSEASSGGGGSGFSFLNNIRSNDDLLAMMDERYGGCFYILHYVTLWLIICFMGVAVGVLGYFVVQLQRWKVHEQFKESRLIYSNVMGGSRDDFPLEGHGQNNLQNSSGRY